MAGGAVICSRIMFGNYRDLALIKLTEKDATKDWFKNLGKV